MALKAKTENAWSYLTFKQLWAEMRFGEYVCICVRKWMFDRNDQESWVVEVPVKTPSYTLYSLSTLLFSPQELPSFLWHLEDCIRAFIFVCVTRIPEISGLPFPTDSHYEPIGFIHHLIGETLPNHDWKWKAKNILSQFLWFVFIRKTQHHLSRHILYLFFSLLDVFFH